MINEDEFDFLVKRPRLSDCFVNLTKRNLVETEEKNHEV